MEERQPSRRACLALRRRRGGGDIDVLFFELLDDHVHGAIHRTFIFFDDLQGAVGELFAGGGVEEEFAAGLFEVGFVADLDGGVRAQEGFDNALEVLHVRAEEDRLAQGGGFDRILAAFTGEAFADEDEGGRLVEVAEFAGGVDEEAIDLFARAAEIGAEFGAVGDAQAGSFEIFAGFLAAFHVARDDDEEELGKIFAEFLVNAAEDRFFAGVGAAGDENGISSADADLCEEGGDVYGGAFAESDAIEFEVANDAHGFRAGAEGEEAVAVGFILHADAGKSAEELAKEKSEPAIAAEGAIGEPGIHKKGWNATRTRAPEEVRPDFGFHQDDRFGIDDAEGAADVFAAIDGVVDFFDVAGETFAEFAHSGGGGGRDDDLEIREAGFERADEMGGHVHLADADGVDPEDVAIGEGLFEAGVEFAEALREAGLPVPPAGHSPKVVGRTAEEKERKKDVIPEPHPCFTQPKCAWNKSPTTASCRGGPNASNVLATL
jgi:hypothetical protein